MNKHHAAKIFSKILIAVLSIGINLGTFGNIAFADFDETATESSAGNVIGAGTLDLGLVATLSPWVFDRSTGTTTAEKTIGIASFGTLPFQYNASTTVSAECIGIDAEIRLTGQTIYSGALENATTSATTTPGDISLLLTLPIGYEQGVACSFDVDFRAWQTNVGNYGENGFSDAASLNERVSESSVMINKVYYDVNTEYGTEANEWIELRNNASSTVDISGWRLCDNVSCDELPEGSYITGFGHTLVSATSATWQYWNIPDNFAKIVIDDSKIGNGLGNAGDILTLERSDATVVDAMNWGTDTSYWNPGIPLVLGEGYALGRITNVDTDTASDFKEMAPPTVDLLSPDEADDSRFWYWGQSYAITWNADNLHGSNEDLSIDLYYIKDENHNQVIDNADTIHVIADNIANSGAYDWTVPSGFVGYIWVRVVATAPENPMLSSQTTSGKIYDPFPTKMWENDPDGVIDMIIADTADEGKVVLSDTVDRLETVGSVADADEELAEDEVVPYNHNIEINRNDGEFVSGEISQTLEMSTTSIESEENEIETVAEEPVLDQVDTITTDVSADSVLSESGNMNEKSTPETVINTEDVKTEQDDKITDDEVVLEIKVIVHGETDVAVIQEMGEGDAVLSVAEVDTIVQGNRLRRDTAKEIVDNYVDVRTIPVTLEPADMIVTDILLHTFDNDGDNQTTTEEFVETSQAPR